MPTFNMAIYVSEEDTATFITNKVLIREKCKEMVKEEINKLRQEVSNE